MMNYAFLFWGYENDLRCMWLAQCTAAVSADASPLLLLLLLLPFHFVLHFHFLISCLFSLLIPGFFGKFTTNCVCVVNSKNSQEESIRKVNKIFIFSIAKHVWHTVLYNITETEIIIELGNSIRLIWVQGTVEVTEYIENMYILCVLYN